MNTQIEMPDKYREFLLQKAAEVTPGPYYPEHFLKKLKTHLGCIPMLTPFLNQDKNDRRNLIVAVVGDSITAGHFEQKRPFGQSAGISDYRELLEYFFIDIDAVYHEQLRKMLWKEYPLTPVSMVNFGAAGDTIEGVEERLEREVLSIKPDLVILNASMNFSIHHGSAKDYERHFRHVVEMIQQETELILVTPNMAEKTETDAALAERVEVIRKLSEEKKIPLADAYRIWKELFAAYPEAKIEELMANKTNHPTRAGHRVYAILLMKLLEDREKEMKDTEYQQVEE